MSQDIKVTMNVQYDQKENAIVLNLFANNEYTAIVLSMQQSMEMIKQIHEALQEAMGSPSAPN